MDRLRGLDGELCVLAFNLMPIFVTPSTQAVWHFPLLANTQTQEKPICQILTLFTLNYLRLESETRNFLYTVTNSYIMQF